MDLLQTVVFVLAFVTFAAINLISYMSLTHAPVLIPVHAAPEPSLEDLRNQLYI